jgi:Peptidase_C39 like family
MASKIDEKLIAPINFFGQQKFNYCGPACVQMFLSHFSIQVVQSLVFETIKGLNTESNAFYSDPDGISSYLSSAVPDSIFISIDDFSSDTVEEALSKIYYTVNFLGLPCITLTLQGAHWIVIDGIRYTLDTEDNKKITAVRYKDPYENSPNEGCV